ncbi:MAG: helix-turn-helix transcriptional regulator [Lachnospiraceae bacterium]|nr:helix-turn-helix transcriptional regulator [Lachnospiraceae bacterium]
MGIQICLSEIMKEKKIKSKDLCKQIGITEANLSVLRSGKAKGVRLSTINKICYYLGCDVGDILKFDGNLDPEEDEEE